MGLHKRKHGTKERISVTMQLYVGDDNDLIQWVETIPGGERQQTIKNALRYALGLPIPEPRADEIEMLQGNIEALERALQDERQRTADLDNIRHTIANLPTLITRLAPKPTADVADSDRIRAIEDAVNQIAEWARATDEQLARLEAHASDTPEREKRRRKIEPELDEDEAAERATRLKRARW